MITPPDNIQSDCPSNISPDIKPCSTSELPLNTTVSTTGPLNNCSSNVFEQLTNLEVSLSITFVIDLRITLFRMPYRNFRIQLFNDEI